MALLQMPFLWSLKLTATWLSQFHLLRALSCTGRYVEVCHALSIIDTLSGTPASMANIVQVSHGSVASLSNLSPM